MGRSSGKLTVKQVERLNEPGRYNDGDGLYLFIKKAGGKSWILRTRIKGRQTDLGLGGVSYVTLSEAREKAHELRKIARLGGDPRLDQKKKIPTYAELAEKTHLENAPTWKNPKHAQQWINTQRTYAFPIIGGLPVDQIDSSHILKVLSPIWTEKNETARRLMQRMSTVLDQAKALKLRTGENPVAEVSALRVLPKVKAKVKSHAALPWQEIPAFYQKLCKSDAVSALALRFTILCGTRTSETRFATWKEIESDVWSIPAERMKADKEHRVPLSKEALRILEGVRGHSDELIFEGARRGKAMSENTMLKLAKSLTDQPVTTHGFRSSFRDWVGEKTNTRFEAAEEALAHAYKTSTQASYLRSDFFEERRLLMERWAQFVAGDEAEVVRIA